MLWGPHPTVLRIYSWIYASGGLRELSMVLGVKLGWLVQISHLICCTVSPTLSPSLKCVSPKEPATKEPMASSALELSSHPLLQLSREAILGQSQRLVFLSLGSLLCIVTPQRWARSPRKGYLEREQTSVLFF